MQEVDTASYTPTFEGACHCGTIRVSFRTRHTAETLPVRRCGCSFCRIHGARTAADAQGELEITEAAPGAIRYRFGLKTADFLICRGCGTYVAAIVEDAGALYATLNVNLLEERDRLDPTPPLVHYDGETEAERRARRRMRWTPTKIRQS